MPQPTPARKGFGRITCVRTGTEGLSWGNWMVVRVSPGTPGMPLRPGALLRPFLFNKLSPLRGCWAAWAWIYPRSERPASLLSG